MPTCVRAVGAGGGGTRTNVGGDGADLVTRVRTHPTQPYELQTGARGIFQENDVATTGPAGGASPFGSGGDAGDNAGLNGAAADFHVGSSGGGATAGFLPDLANPVAAAPAQSTAPVVVVVGVVATSAAVVVRARPIIARVTAIRASATSSRVARSKTYRSSMTCQSPLRPQVVGPQTAPSLPTACAQDQEHSMALRTLAPSPAQTLSLSARAAPSSSRSRCRTRAAPDHSTMSRWQLAKQPWPQTR